LPAPKIKFMIIWIASYPKSGNTYIRSFISSYFFSKKGKFDFSLLLNVMQFPSLRFSKKDNFNFEDAAKNWLKNQNYFFDEKKNFFLKTHNSLDPYKGQEFTTSNETAGAIYIVRDPRNVILSMCHHYSFTFDFAYNKIINEEASLSQKANNGDCSNFTYLGSWSKHYRSWRDTKKFKVLFIKYEDLKDNKHKVFKKVIKFINDLNSNETKFNEKKFINSINSTNFVNLKNKELNEGFGENYISKDGKKINFFNQGFKNKWQNDLPKDIVDKINKDFEKELIELNYL
jgi:hypothetical protein